MYSDHRGFEVKPRSAPVFAAEATPAGPCPDDIFLRKLARKSKKISIADPRIDHAANCPRCEDQLLLLRHEHRSQRVKIALGTVLAVSVVLTAVRYAIDKGAFRSSTVQITQPVDLRGASVLGDQQKLPLQSVGVPAAVVRITIFLPSSSSRGQYLVAVKRHQNKRVYVVDEGIFGKQDGDRQPLTVDLDLRRAEAGQYFLSIYGVDDQVLFSYPLRVR